MPFLFLRKRGDALPITTSADAPPRYSEFREKISGLLERYRSGEAYRAGRNAAVLAATLIAIRLLNVGLHDVSLFGIKVSPSAFETARILMTVVLGYFLTTLYIYSFRDHSIQKDRWRIVTAFANDARTHLSKLGKDPRVDDRELRQRWQSLLKEWIAHQGRFKAARRSDAIGFALELGVPTILAAVALWLLWRNDYVLRATPEIHL